MTSRGLQIWRSTEVPLDTKYDIHDDEVSRRKNLGVLDGHSRAVGLDVV